jgi:hypothetical protein
MSVNSGSSRYFNLIPKLRLSLLQATFESRHLALDLALFKNTLKLE